MACQAIANIVKTSLGPVGLDKVRLHFISLFKFYSIEGYVHNEDGMPESIFSYFDDSHEDAVCLS